MITIEIPENPNCAAVDLRVFHDLEPPRPVSQVHLEQLPGRQPAWYEVTGWTLEGTTCPAWLQKVDDSGEGVAFLLWGGAAGLRFRPADSRAPWNLGDRQQWGAPFLLVAEAADVKSGPPPKKTA